MKHSNRWVMVVLMIAALQLSACAQAPTKSTKVEPAKVEEVEGSEFKRVILTEKAAERIGIQTVSVRDEQVGQKHRVGGEVMLNPLLPNTGGSGAAPVDANAVWVRVSLNGSERSKVDLSQPARVLPLDDDEGEGLAAEFDEDLASDDDEDTDTAEEALYYIVNNAEQGLSLGQRVFVELPLSSSGTQQPIVPYAAVIYGVEGETWVYTSPEPLVFIRQPIRIDYIEGDLAILLEGPPADTEVVTVGAAELLGAELGVGK